MWEEVEDSITRSVPLEGPPDDNLRQLNGVPRSLGGRRKIESKEEQVFE
jgi:hypothetical protein